MNFQCVVEVFEGINFKIYFNKKNNGDVDIKKIYILLKNNNSVEVTNLEKIAIEGLKDLINDEIESIPFMDSTVRVSLDFPN